MSPARTRPSRALDSNVLVYAVAGSGPKAVLALELVRGGGVISVQALDGTANVLRRKARLEWDAVGEALHLLRRLLDVVPLDEATHERGVRLAHATGYSVWDAMILSAALGAGCEALLSEDMQDGHMVEGLTIRNPFAAVGERAEAP